jgi:hypothetical protein
MWSDEFKIMMGMVCIILIFELGIVFIMHNGYGL